MYRAQIVEEDYLDVLRTLATTDPGVYFNADFINSMLPDKKSKELTQKTLDSLVSQGVLESVQTSRSLGPLHARGSIQTSYRFNISIS